MRLLFLFLALPVLAQDSAPRWIEETDFEAPGLSEADKKLEYSRLSPQDKLSYDHFVDMRRSDNSTIYTAKLEGLAEGKLTEKIEIAKKMKAEGMDVDLILKITGLDQEP